MRKLESHDVIPLLMLGAVLSACSLGSTLGLSGTSPSAPLSSPASSASPAANGSTTSVSAGTASTADDAAQQDHQASVPDDGTKDAAHAANIGKVVFAHAVIPPENAAATAFVKTTSLREPLHMRVYMAGSAYNLVGKAGKACSSTANTWWTTTVRINDATDEVEVSSIKADEDHFKQWTTFRLNGPLLGANMEYPRDDDNLNSEGVVGSVIAYRFAAGVIPRLHVGKNTLHFAVEARCGDTTAKVAAADLDVTLASGDDARFFAAHGPHLKTYPIKEFASLAASARAVYRDHFSDDLIAMKPLADWDYTQNDRGVVIMRKLTVAVIARKHGGDTCTITQIGIEQQAAGPGQFSHNLDFGGESLNQPIPFPCLLAKQAS
ncbi:MAG: hypothetical protein ABJE66_08925 [Deltaproteobacteria bacterium]